MAESLHLKYRKLSTEVKQIRLSCKIEKRIRQYKKGIGMGFEPGSITYLYNIQVDVFNRQRIRAGALADDKVDAFLFHHGVDLYCT